MIKSLERECNDLKTSITVDMEEYLHRYVNFIYNSGDFVSFTRYYEENLKSREEKIIELFEKNRFILSDSKMLMGERDKILSDPMVDFSKAREYLDIISRTGMFRPFC